MYIGQKPTLQVPSDPPLALQLLKWSAGHPELRTAAAATARKLSDAFMTSGYFDRWSESLRAALRVAETIGDTDTGAWARHNLGAAVDVTLIDMRTGNEVPMGTNFDTFSVAAHTANARGGFAENRQRLKKALERHGFQNYENEWWHFSYDVENPVRFDRVIH